MYSVSSKVTLSHNEAILDFTQKMQEANICCNDQIIADGEYHRFKVAKRKAKPGWYILSQDHDGHYYGAAGVYGHYNARISFSSSGKKLSQEQKTILKETMNKAIQDRNEKLKAQYTLVSQEINKILPLFNDIGETEYIKRKRISVKNISIYYGTGYIEALLNPQTKKVKSYKLHPGNNTFIVIPICDLQTSAITSLQIIYDVDTSCSLINQEGKTTEIKFNSTNHKSYLKGGRKQGSAFVIGEKITLLSIICICEGFATAASIYQAGKGKWIVVVAFDAGNIEPVTQTLKSLYPYATIIICADNDQWKEVNTGKVTAEKVAAKYGCKIALPEFSSVNYGVSHDTQA